MGRPWRNGDGAGAEHDRTCGTTCAECEVRARTEWSVLSREELATLEPGRITRTYLPGETIFQEGAPAHGVHCMQGGMVGIRKLDVAGNSTLLRLVHAGEALGYRALLTTNEHRTTAEALTLSRVCFLDGAAVRRLLARNPALGLRFLEHAARDLESAEDKVLQNVTLSVRARLAHLLLVLKDRYLVSERGESFEMTLPLSRQDMAAMIGIRPESMSRTIRQFQQDGLAEFHGRSVRVDDITCLLDELGESAEFPTEVPH